MESKGGLIVMVDDDITNLTVAKSTLVDEYDFISAPSGKKLFLLLEKLTPDLILLDIEMPEMDGYEVIKQLKSSEKTAHIPVIFLTAKIDPENEVKGLNMGAVDYITKPFSRELLIKRIQLHLLFEAQKKELMNYSRNLETEVDKKTKTVFELQNAILKTVSELVECRDNVTGGHIERTQHNLSMLLKFLLKHGVYTEELSSWDINLFVMSSQLHDVGKISIKDNILMKPGKLTEEEFEEMKRHTVYGEDIIKNIEKSTTENAFLQHAEILAGSHHEKWNGEGYPRRLKGNDIPLQGRLMAIVDVYDALTNDRPYKEALTHEEAVEIIKKGVGTHFDPLINEVFLMYEKEFKHTAKSIFSLDAANDRMKSANELRATLKMVAGIADFRGGTEADSSWYIRRYLEIFLDALLKHERFKAEVSGWNTELFLISAQLHDVGKMTIDNDILNKPERLTEDEFKKLKTHADFGVRIIRQIKENVDDGSMLNHAEALVGSHHEKWDGTGYPLGLEGKNIPLQGRIMAIVDVYEALINDRPHRGKKTHKEAVEIIKKDSGTYFDPELIEVFLEIEPLFEMVETEEAQTIQNNLQTA